MRKGTVVVGYCHPGVVRAEWHESMFNLLAYDATHSRRVLAGGRYGVQSSANISAARNQIVEGFLSTEAEWLFMVDTDMVFEPDLIDRLVAAADPVKAPVVGGLCFGIDNGALFATMYDLSGTVDDPAVVRYDVWPRDRMHQVFATGAACLLIHRGVLERIRDHRDETTGRPFSPVNVWFEETTFNGSMRMGEDVTFCFRANRVGASVWVHTGIHVGHVKHTVLTADVYDAQQVAKESTGAEVAD